MRAVFLVFAFLAAMVAPAAAFDLTDYNNWNREYEELPGPMVYRAEEEPAWLPAMLDKLQSARMSRSLYRHYLFRGDSGPSYLVTKWYGDDFDSVIEIHRIEKNKVGNPSAKYLEGYGGDIVWVVVPTGHDIFGDGVPVLFVLASPGGSSDDDQTVLIIRLGDVPKNITPGQFGNVARVAFPNDGKTLILLTKDLDKKFSYDTCGVCYIMPEMLLAWRNGHYAPACRDNAEFYRASMKSFWQRSDGEEPYSLQNFMVRRMGGIWDAIQAGDIPTAMRVYRDTIAEARRRRTNWPIWEGRIPPTSAEYKAELANYEKEFLPLLQEAQRHAKSQCPLTTGRALSGSSKPFQMIPPSPSRDVP